MLKIHDEDEENADYGRVLMYQALKYRKEVGKLIVLCLTWQAIIKKFALTHRKKVCKNAVNYGKI